jgi:hypothetical protein
MESALRITDVARVEIRRAGLLDEDEEDQGNGATDPQLIPTFRPFNTEDVCLSLDNTNNRLSTSGTRIVI